MPRLLSYVSIIIVVVPVVLGVVAVVMPLLKATACAA
jgi:hypothetical protein